MATKNVGGEVVPVIVVSANSGTWQFNYCENAIEIDRSHGFTVTIKEDPK